VVPAGCGLRRLLACWEEFLSNPDRRKDHSFFGRAIAVITGMILPEDLLNDQPAAPYWRADEESFAMTKRACGIGRCP